MVNVTFNLSGVSNMNNGVTILTIDGQSYDYYHLPKTFQWQAGSTHTVVASTPLLEWDQQTYLSFSSWTNGNGLNGASGTFTTPNSAVTVTANYAVSSVTITFTTSGLPSTSSTVLTIDNTAYSTYQLATQQFVWLEGSTHTVAASTPLYDSQNNGYQFTGWTNGNGLVGTSGTFTVPNANTQVTANYAPSTVHVNFAQTGLSNMVSGETVLTIDGTPYDYWGIQDTTFTWTIGSTHTVVASTPVHDTQSNGFQFSSWTNGDGLTSASGTLTVPNSNAVVTVNYVPSTVHVSFAETGLSNMNNGETVLTIDGTAYDYWGVQTTNFIWNIGSTHTVVASTPITGYDGVTHYFSTWTNGNGLTTASGTVTTPNSGTTITVNYVQTLPPATALTVSCNPTTVSGTATMTISGELTSSGSAVACQTITLTYSSGSNWLPITTVTTASNGAYTYNWNVPTTIPSGQFTVQAVFAGNSCYSGSSATATAYVSLLAAPECAWGSLIAVVVCFAAAVLFVKTSFRSKRPGESKVCKAL